MVPQTTQKWLKIKINMVNIENMLDKIKIE